MRPYQTFRVLEDLRRNVSVPLCRGGVSLSRDDRETTLDVYQQWLLLCVDLGYLQPETLQRDARRLLQDLVEADVLSLNNGFAECLQSIRLQIARGFKVLCSNISHHLYHLIKDDFSRVLSGDPVAAKRLVQLFSYTSRLTLQDIDLTQQMIEGYLDDESGIPEDYPENLLSPIRNILNRWLGSFLPEEIVPHHGPGGVAHLGRCDLIVKYKNLTTDDRLKYAFGSPWWVDEAIPVTLDRISQTIFVPKSYKTFRTISMEPPTLQYFQQGVWGVIDNLVAHDRYLRNHIGFHDSERNCSLARQGSITRQYATLDLSSASDSVGYSLVKKLFKGTWLLRYLVATRSTHTLLPDGRRIELRKFAPMGSSLCFPIETFIFAAICEHVTRVHHVTGDYSVYGDDIIVPTQCVESVVRILTRLGFRVNTQKSYDQLDCWFRESCGGEYCDGYDVTPMRVSRKYMHKDDVVRASKWYDMANTAYAYDFRNLRYFFIEKIRKSGIAALYSPTSLVSDNYSNYHLKLRWRRRFQRLELYADAYISESTKKESPQEEAYRLRHWYESTTQRLHLFEPFISDIHRTVMRKRRIWQNAPEGTLDRGYLPEIQKSYKDCSSSDMDGSGR